MKKIAIIAAVFTFSVSGLAQAATSTGNLSVSAIVTSTCSVQSGSLPLASAATARVGVNCSSGTAYTISLDASTTATSRQLISDGSQQSVPVFSTASNGQNLNAGNAGDVVGITLSY